MIAHLLTHIRRTPKAAVATAVEFSDLSFEARTVESALSGLAPLLVERIRGYDPVDRLPYLTLPPAELSRVPISINPAGGGGGEPLAVILSIVVVQREAAGRSVFVGWVPAVPNFNIVAYDRATLEEHLVTGLKSRLKRWTAMNLLAACDSDESSLEEIEVDVPEGSSSLGDEDSGDSLVEEFGTNLTARSAANELVRLDGRDELVETVLRTLALEGRNSVMLVGPNAVGKSALIHELATRLRSDDVPDRLRGTQLWRISANELIAGAQYIGQWQDRARRLLSQTRARRMIVAMDDPIGIIDAGQWSRSTNNLGRYLRPHIESGALTVICETTHEQLQAARKKEPGFVDAFRRINMEEPPIESVHAIVEAAAKRIASATGRNVDANAVRAAIELTRRFEPYRGFPGKAVRLLEETAREGNSDVGATSVTTAFASRTGMPLSLLLDDIALDIRAVRGHFEARLLGQPDPVDAMVNLVAVIKAGLNDPGKPLGSFFFVGPTGVGKTELAKALAELLFGSRDRVLRFDMAEYSSGDAVQRLIGSKWSSEGEGTLTNAIREQPFSVVLLDEIEKAHAPVFDALLAALGEGRLSDASGRTADFRNAIIIMTSNLGAGRSRSPALGFTSDDSNESTRLQRHYFEQAEKFFRPEFFNRIDQIVVFEPLSEMTVRQIARREVGRLLLREGVVRRRLLVEVDEHVIDHVATEGFHPQYGARPLHRAIEQAVIQPLARLMVEENPKLGDLVRIYLRDGSIRVDLEKLSVIDQPPERRGGRTEPERSLRKAVQAAEDVATQIDAEHATAGVGFLRSEVEELIESTHRPTFWDSPAEARGTMTRIYRIENVLDRLDSLRNRAAGLVDMARAVRSARDRKRVAEIHGAVEEIEDALLVTRLELAGAAGESAGRNAAMVRVTPIGADAADWAAELLEMYKAWAERTARETSPASGSHTLKIEGLSTFDLLRGEEGIHRRIRADQVHLARVSILPVNGEAPTEVGLGEDAGRVVRVYEEGRRQLVRDPRTRVKLNRIEDVLREGRIDPFLLAMLKSNSESGVESH